MTRRGAGPGRPSGRDGPRADRPGRPGRRALQPARRCLRGAAAGPDEPAPGTGRKPGSRPARRGRGSNPAGAAHRPEQPGAPGQGTPVTISVRPDTLAVATTVPAGWNRFPATIEGILFRGGLRQIQARGRATGPSWSPSSRASLRACGKVRASRSPSPGARRGPPGKIRAGRVHQQEPAEPSSPEALRYQQHQ